MTCIVGLVHDGEVYIGGDSAGVSGYDLTVRADAKVFRREGPDGTPWVFGFTSSFRMGQLIKYAMVLPLVPDDADLFGLMVRVFIPKLRECLREGGWLTKDKEHETGGFFLVGVKGHLFKVESDFQVAEGLGDFLAAGCGEAYALGSLYREFVPLRAERKPVTELRLALEAAEHFSAGVRRPFTIVSTK
jgi:ATP-dependent protease HslVU (ClpYQ) peptidase subunit